MRIKQLLENFKPVLNVINFNYILILVNAALGVASIIVGSYIQSACCFLWAFVIYIHNNPFFRKDNLVMLNMNYFDEDNEIHIDNLDYIGRVASVFNDHLYIDWPCYDNPVRMPKYEVLKLNF